ncbi:hypothetical protein KCP78_04780 [Salmonella enterica subsp. enterica]|nr:hypothetical protein KCP78_04780 [Salmonella enterica subsp. enterica]
MKCSNGSQIRGEAAIRRLFIADALCLPNRLQYCCQAQPAIFYPLRLMSSESANCAN